VAFVDAPQEKHGLTLGATRELLLPATVLGCFGLYYLAEQPFWVVLLCAVPMLILYAVAPLWAAKSMASFDREAIDLLSARQSDALRWRYTRALGLRLFGLPALRAERKAMVLAECGDARGARAAYQEALEEHADRAPLRVMLGLAHSCFTLGDDSRAIAMYRKLLVSAPSLPGVERNLAHALVRQGEDLQDALAMLARAEREPLDDVQKQQIKLLRGLAHAKLGEHARAHEFLAQADPSQEQTAELRGELLKRLLA
jgi:tetratricopeptide (TPR) repeat protein